MALPDTLLGLAHEIRGVLSPLKVATELLAEPGSLEPSELSRLTAVVYEGIRWLERLSDDLVACAYIRSQKLNLQVEDFIPREWVQSVIQLVGPLLRLRGQRVCLHCPEPPPRIQGDPHWLGHALLNLLSNAIRHGRTGDLIEVAVISEGGCVRLSVTDHGAGLGAEPAPTEAPYWPRRMGVGLRLVSLIAALHGGTVGVASEPGQATVFSIDLPATAESSAGGQAP